MTGELNSPEELLWLLTEQETFINLRDSFKSIEQLPNAAGVTKEDFLRIVHKVLEGAGNLQDSHILDLFDRIDCNERNRIMWDTFLDYNLSALRPKQAKTFHCGEVRYTQVKQKKVMETYLSYQKWYYRIVVPQRDAVVKIVLLEGGKYFTYAMLTKYGRVCLYDGGFNYISYYMVAMSAEDQFRSSAEARKRNRWLTDAVFMPDVQMLVFTNSTRSMTIYDASGLRHVPLWLIATFPNTIQVIKYYPKERNDQSSKDEPIKTLILGDNFGEIRLMTFVKPSDDLLKKKHQDKMSIYYYQELINCKDYVRISSMGRVHSDAITSLACLPEQHDTVLSCSKDRKRSLVVSCIGQKAPLLTIPARKGISCFAFSSKHKQIIIGGDNGVLRIYSFHRHCSGSDTAEASCVELCKTKASQAGLLNLVVMEHLNVLLTCDRLAVLKFYDLSDLKCLQMLQLDLARFGALGRGIEWSRECIYPGPKHEGMKLCHLWERNCFLVACCNTFAKIDMFYLDGKDRHLHGRLLGPPPLQNSVLIPIDWGKQEDVPEDNEMITTEARYLQIPHLDFILKKDLVADLAERSNIHSKIALVEERKARMRWAIEHCAPFLALDLHAVDEIQLHDSLPVIADAKTSAIAETTRILLRDASARTIAFSDISSSNGGRLPSAATFQ